MKLYMLDADTDVCSRYLDDYNLINQMTNVSYLLGTLGNLMGTFPENQTDARGWALINQGNAYWLFSYYRSLKDEMANRGLRHREERGIAIGIREAQTIIDRLPVSPVEFHNITKHDKLNFTFIDDIFLANKQLLSQSYIVDKVEPRWYNRTWNMEQVNHYSMTGEKPVLVRPEYGLFQGVTLTEGLTVAGINTQVTREELVDRYVREYETTLNTNIPF